MSYRQKPDPLKNTFPLPNEIFLLGLCPGELAVYAFLRHCEDRKTHQCWPSYKTIGKAVGMTENTVAKYVNALECKGLIQTESTKVLGIAPSSSCELMHEADFPVLKVGSRIVVPKEKFIQWVEQHTKGGECG